LKNKLHVLFINSWYPSRVMPYNGDFIQRHAEAVALTNQVTAVHIITDPNCKQPYLIDIKDINGVNTIIGYVKQTKNTLIKGYLFFSVYLKILKQIGSFDLVHLNVLYPFGILALHLKWFYKKPYLISEHWTGYLDSQSKKISILQKLISKVITKSSSFICPVSNNLSIAMQKFGLKGNYQKIPNVVDTDLFVPKKMNNEVFTLVHISSMLDGHKNTSGILRVILKLQKIIPTFKVKLIGSSTKNMQLFAENSGLDSKFYEFIDQIPQKEVIPHLQQADGLILFSNYENLPCVILEAFSCGIPVISTDIGGIKEYFPDEFGYLIEKKNEGELLDKILLLYKKPIINSKKMHEYAISNFSKNTIADSFSTLYYQSLKQSS